MAIFASEISADAPLAPTGVPHLISLLAGLGFLLAYKLLIPTPPQ
jgi:hypothetical protein